MRATKALSFTKRIPVELTFRGSVALDVRCFKHLTSLQQEGQVGFHQRARHPGLEHKP